jgi:hypothetical protein
MKNTGRKEMGKKQNKKSSSKSTHSLPKDKRKPLGVVKVGNSKLRENRRQKNVAKQSKEIRARPLVNSSSPLNILGRIKMSDKVRKNLYKISTDLIKRRGKPTLAMVLGMTDNEFMKMNDELLDLIHTPYKNDGDIIKHIYSLDNVSEKGKIVMAFKYHKIREAVQSIDGSLKLIGINVEKKVRELPKKNVMPTTFEEIERIPIGERTREQIEMLVYGKYDGSFTKYAQSVIKRFPMNYEIEEEITYKVPEEKEPWRI